MPSNGSEQRDNARPRFFVDAIKNNAESEKAGRPIFDSKTMVEIRIPGDKNMTWVGEVNDKHKERWPDHWAAFQKGELRAASGTPLEEWPNPELTKGRVAELKAMDILSVEELAGVSDGLLPKMGMGARELRDQAKAYIDRAKGGAGNAAMVAELARLKEMVERLTGNVPPAVAQDKSIEDCTDAELKEFIKRETGEGVRGNPSRETLIARAKAIAEKEAA